MHDIPGYGTRLAPDMIQDHLAKEVQAKAAFQAREYGSATPEADDTPMRLGVEQK